MKRFSEQFHTKSKSIKLSSAEKAQLQERLTSYMEYHPLPAHLKATKRSSSKTATTHESFTTLSIPFGWLFKSSAAVAAFVLLVVPFMAERSVPGDSLYAVKVQFNEEVRSSLTFDSVQKVEWETQRVNRRIAEARLLESEGRLTEEVEAEVAQAVRTHTQNAQREIASLRETDAEEATIASIAFDSMLEAQAVSLKDDDETVEVSEVETVATNRATPVKKPQSLIADAVDESRALNEQPNASSTPSYGKLMARVEISTTRMYELRDSIAQTDSEAYKNITRRIEDIERSIEQAIDKSTNATDESQQILIDVLKRSQKLIVFMTDLEVSHTVDIEELVPVVLTNEEQVAKKEAYNTELTQKLNQIQTTLDQATSTPSDVRTKVEGGLEQVAGLRTQMQTASTFAQYKVLATEAIEIVTDSLQTLEMISNPAPQPVTPAPAEDSSPTTTASSSATTTASTSTEATEQTATASSSATTTATSSVDV